MIFAQCALGPHEAQRLVAATGGFDTRVIGSDPNLAELIAWATPGARSASEWTHAPGVVF